MSFKESVDFENKKVFLNINEFAETKIVKYDGKTFVNIPVLLTKTKERKRTVVSSDHAEGIHLVSAVAHIALEDMGGIVPEQKRSIEISDGKALGTVFYRKYRIVTSDCEMGMLNLELEAYDE